MNEVMRSQQLLREGIRFGIILNDLNEQPNPSSTRNCHVMVMPEFVSRIHCWCFVLLKPVEESLCLHRCLLRSDVLSLVPRVTGTYTCRSQ